MNRINTLAGLLLVAGAVSAQGRFQGIKPMAKGLIPAPVAQVGQTHGTAKAGGGNCLFAEDFETGTVDDLIGNGWVAGPQVEEQNDDTGVGTGVFINPWRVDVAATGGSTYLPIPDDPSGNHFIVANDDGDPCNCGMDSIYLVTPAIDFSGQTEMSVSFRAYSDEQFGGGQMLVKASSDGGNTWTTVYTVPPVQGAFQNIVADLSAFDGMPSVKIAWTWSDLASWATGVAVDDICVAPILPNNLTLQHAYSADITGDATDLTVNTIEYTFMPLEQVQPLTVSAGVLNNGGMEQTNVVLTAHVFMDGSPVGDFTSDVVPSMARGALDTLVVNTGWTPSSPGMVTVDVEVTADQTDDNPGDNDGHTAVRITDAPEADLYSSWGTDDNAAQSFGGGGTDAYKIGNLLEVTRDNSIAYGVYVAFGTVEAGTVVNGQLLDASQSDFPALVGSDDFIVQPWLENNAGGNQMTYIPFTEPFALTAETEVLPVLSTFGGAEVRYSNSGNSVPQTSFFYGDGGSGIDWYYTTTTPMIRLVLAEAPVAPAGVDDLVNGGLSLGPNVPNPFNENTTIQYELSDVRHVTITVTDVDGKVVLAQDLGTKGHGRHAYDISAANLAAGAYSYTLTAGDARLTRRMMVVK